MLTKYNSVRASQRKHVLIGERHRLLAPAVSLYAKRIPRFKCDRLTADTSIATRRSPTVSSLHERFQLASFSSSPLFMKV